MSEPNNLPLFLRNPGGSYEFVTWLRRFLDDPSSFTRKLGTGSGGGTQDLEVVIDGLGAVITTGIKGDVRIDFDCTITQWTLLADQSGGIAVDVWKDTYANYPPTIANTITGSDEPTLSATAKNTSTALTGWTTSIAAGDTLRFHVDSASTVTRVTLTLKLTPA